LNYQVLARKWRPQTYEELVGQSQITRTLRNAIEADRLAHTYIFAGLRGTGKTTAARILAKCLNCEKGPTAAPCGQCAACQEIADSRALDVLEVDAASRTKVEQTRELLEVVAYAPVRDRYKILIIDEAHMLSKASFNALLKTLEEPPPNVMFILATTEIQKILPTILSRCQIFEFRRVGARELADHLQKICENEQVTISRPALERIARAGEGSVRDSLSVLERVLAFCGSEVGDEDLLRMLGGVRAQVLTDLVAALARRDAAGMLTVLDGLVDEGHDLHHFWKELVAAIRDLLLQRTVPGNDDLLSRSAEEAGALLTAAEGLSLEDLTRVFQILADLEPALRSSSQPRFLFEAALIRLASLGAVRPIEQVLSEMRGAPPPQRSAKPTQEKKSPDVAPPVPDPVPGDPPASAEVRESAGSFAFELVGAVHKGKPVLGAVLEQAAAIDVQDDTLVLTFKGAAAAMARPLERKESLILVQGHAERLLGSPVAVRLEIEGRQTINQSKSAVPEVKPVTAAGKSGAPRRRRPSPAAAIDEPGAAALLERASQEPGVKKLLREFGAQVVDIRPLERPKDLTSQDGKTEPVEDTR
jgi:DNA polymerase-3 subunit gamma/tau